MKNKKERLENLFEKMLKRGIEVIDTEIGVYPTFGEISPSSFCLRYKKEQGLVKIEVILNPVDHPEFCNLRGNITPIHIRLILERYGLRPCKTSVSEILPKHQNATHSFDRRRNQDLRDEFRRLEAHSLLSRKERKGNPLDVVFSKDSPCPYSHCRSTRKQSKNGH